MFFHPSLCFLTFWSPKVAHRMGLCQKKGFRKKMCTFCFCLFHVGKRKRQNMKNMEKDNFKKSPEKQCFLGGCEEFFMCLQNCHFLEKYANTICVRKVKKSAHFRCNYLFWENVTFFGAHWKSPNTTKIGVSADTGENPKWHFWLQKCHFGFSLEKGFYYLWCLKAVFRWKHDFYNVFSKTQLCRHERMYLDNKNKNLPKIVVVCQNAKRSCFGMFFLFFGGFVFCCLCFCSCVL